jgi:hypothetical protein
MMDSAIPAGAIILSLSYSIQENIVSGAPAPAQASC